MASHAREGHKAERRESLLITVAAPAEGPPQSPLDFTLAVMRDPLKPDALRASLAKAALPYVHGRWCPLGSDPRDAQVGSTRLAPLNDAPLLPHREAGRVPSESEAGGVLHARTPPGALRAPPSPEGEGEEESPHDVSTPAATKDVDGRVKPGHDENKERVVAAESCARESAQRAIAAEARMRESEQRAIAAEARIAELAAQESVLETMLARVKSEWPDIFDASGAVRAAPCDMFAQLVEAQEHARSLEERAIMAEGRLREAQCYANDMEQRACASEALIAGRR